jgi:hypothetical protein
MLAAYEPHRVPDPITNAGALIVINDRSDGVPRGRVALSNGSTWDLIAFEIDVPRETQPAQNVAPMVHQIVRDMLPALIPPQQLVSLPPPMPQAVPQLPASDDLRAVSEALLAMAEHINQLQHRVHEQDERIAYLEHHAADKSQIRIAGAA